MISEGIKSVSEVGIMVTASGVLIGALKRLKSKDKDIIECIRLGADDFMTKPFSLEVLEEKIKALLRN